MAEPIEKNILDWLEANQIDAYTDEPEYDRYSDYRFVVIQKTGSQKSNKVCESTVAIQSYAPTVYDAAVLNETIKELMEGLVSDDRVTGVDLNSDYEFTKTSTKQPRYQAVFNIHHY